VGGQVIQMHVPYLVEVNCPLVGEGANDHSSDVGGAYNQLSDVGGEVVILKHVNFE
jgi:hypothetical protein